MTVRPACVQAVAVLHCLQRLAGHPLLAEQLLNAPGALGRLWACLGCGADHIVAEGARLLVRLFAPAPARHGAPPWRLLRGEVVLLLPSLPLCIHPSRPPVASLAMPSRLQLGQKCLQIVHLCHMFTTTSMQQGTSIACVQFPGSGAAPCH